MHALVVSPIPSDPINQGNSARIGRFCELLQYHGYRVHFVYYGLEGLSPHQESVMRARWDWFHYVQPRISKKQTRSDGFGIDDYCGSELPAFIEHLQRSWRFDIAVINYVWSSRVAEAIRPETFSVIDTHDLFGGRQQLLQEQGVAPAWFFCSPQQEAMGLARANAAIAIQDAEALVLTGRVENQLFTIGHILPKSYLPVPARADRIRVGYLASGNPSNRLSFEELIECLKDRPDITDRFEFRIAGAIGQYVPNGQPGFVALGFVEDAVEFYRDVDLIININISGTGLKIKTVEALAHGMPIITTRDGMCGIATNCKGHLCDDLEELLDCLEAISGEDDLLRLRAESCIVFENYTKQQLANFRAMLDVANSHVIESRAS